MRSYLVVIDGSDEARVALRFAARRAAKTGGTLEILALVAPQEFVAWGGVQKAMEEEARLRAEALVVAAAGEIIEDAGIHPVITVRNGMPIETIKAMIADHRDVAALVLGAAASGPPGPLVSHFAGAAGSMACPLMIIPGALDDAALDRLS